MDDRLWEGYRESRRCSRDTYPESYITEYTSIRGILGVVVTEAGSYSRLIDSCITQLEAQGPSRTCNESKEEEAEDIGGGARLIARLLRTMRERRSLYRGTSLIRNSRPP